MNMVVTSPLTYILLQSDTRAVRFWFGLTTLFYGVFLASNPNDHHWEYVLTLYIMPYWAWALGFLVAGPAMIYGSLTTKCNRLLMLLEAFVNTGLWVGVAVSSMMSQGGPGAITIAALMSIWLSMRYPSWRRMK